MAVIDAGARIYVLSLTPPPTALDASRRQTACITLTGVINPGNMETCIYSFDNRLQRNENENYIIR